MAERSVPGDAGDVRSDFPGYSGGESLEASSWDEGFEDPELAMVEDDAAADG